MQIFLPEPFWLPQNLFGFHSATPIYTETGCLQSINTTAGSLMNHFSDWLAVMLTHTLKLHVWRLYLTVYRPDSDPELEKSDIEHG